MADLLSACQRTCPADPDFAFERGEWGDLKRERKKTGNCRQKIGARSAKRSQFVLGMSRFYKYLKLTTVRKGPRPEGSACRVFHLQRPGNGSLFCAPGIGVPSFTI
jgi:hypothetical protein